VNGREKPPADELELYIEPPTIPPGMTIRDYRFARPVRGRRHTFAWRWRSPRAPKI